MAFCARIGKRGEARMLMEHAVELASRFVAEGAMDQESLDELTAFRDRLS
jgi:hypothetical protein